MNPLRTLVLLALIATTAYCASDPVTISVTGISPTPIAAEKALFGKAPGFVLRLQLIQPGKAAVSLKAARPSFVLEGKEKPSSTLRLVRLGNDEKRGRVATMGSSKMMPMKDLEYPNPDACVEFEVKEEKPGTWLITPKKDLTVGEWAFYLYRSRGLSADNITAELFGFAIE